MSNSKQTSELSKWIDNEVGFDTLTVHGGTIPDPHTGAILTPVYNSTAFVQPSVEDYLSYGYSYSRQNNPTVRALENRITAIYGGHDTICVSSGMAAICTLFSALLSPGDHCIMPDCSYGGTNRCARVYYSRYNIEFTFVDQRDINNIKKAIKKTTKMIYTETPSNPVLRLTDIKAVSELAKEHKILHVCDPTFATPYILQVFESGVDIAVESLTKYVDGHNTAVAGALILRSAEHYEQLSLYRNILGNIMSPQVASTLLLTVKTLAIRVVKQSETAMKIAKFLEGHKVVESVSYPGLESHPQHKLAKSYYKRNLYGGMICFEIKGGTDAGRKLMNTIKRPWTLCENLGSTESIITCPSVFTHANMLKEDRLKVGITDGLIRLSVGLESDEDLITSLDLALNNI